MNTRTAAVTLLLGVSLTASCSLPSTYDQAAERCIAAVRALPKGAQIEPRPKACERMTKKDYNLIGLDKTLRDAGLIDKDGRVVTTPTP